MQEKLRLDYNFLNSYLKLFNATAEFENDILYKVRIKMQLISNHFKLLSYNGYRLLHISCKLMILFIQLNINHFSFNNSLPLSFFLSRSL